MQTVSTVQTSDGVTLTYARFGKPKKGTILLLHGLGGDFSAWDPYIGPLANAGYQTLSLDLRGHGTSDRPDEADQYSLQRLGIDVVELLEKERIEQAVIIGHCLGAIIGQQVAVTSQNVSKLVCISPTAHTYRWSASAMRRQRLRRLLQSIAARLPEKYDPQRFGMLKNVATGDFSLTRIAQDLQRTSLRSYAAMLLQVMQFDLRQELESLDIPLLLIAGENDHIFPTRFAKEMEAGVKSVQLHIIPEANHQVPLTHPRVIVDRLFSWL